MGLIGNVLSVIGIPSSTDRAMLDTLCLAALADGTASELELGHAREIALEMPGFRRKQRADLQAELEEVLASIRDADPHDVMRRIADALDGDMREQAYALAAVIVYVDLDKRADESRFLADFRAALSLTDQRARAILDEIEREVADIERGDHPAPGT